MLPVFVTLRSKGIKIIINIFHIADIYTDRPDDYRIRLSSGIEWSLNYKAYQAFLEEYQSVTGATNSTNLPKVQ